MLNLHHLRIFFGVAKRMSFTKAAADLSITQPAVTNQIKAFEEQLGLKLFEVKAGKIVLTQEGKTLCEYAGRLFEIENEIEKVVSDLKASRVGVISLGTARTYSHTLLPLLIGHFHKFYPNIMVRVDEAGSLEIIERLLDFQNEIAICIKVADNPDICFIPFCTEELVVVMPVDHHLSARERLTINDLADEKIILRGKGSASRLIVDQLFARSNIVPHIFTEANNTELIKNMVQGGEGISFLSRIAVTKEVAEGRLAALSLGDRGIPLDITIAHLKNHVLSPPAVVFLNVLQELASQNGSTGSASGLINILEGSSAD